MDDGDLLTHPILRTRRAMMPPDEGNEQEQVAAGDAYATVKGQRHAEGLRFIRPRRRCFTMSYSYVPIPWWESPALLMLEYPGFFTVALHGKRLDELEPRISDRRVTWIRECDPATAASLPLAVFRIEVLHAYPSRIEEAIGPED